MFYYAQLDENNICTDISSLSGEVVADNMILLASMDEDYMWRKYENGQWSVEKYEPAPPVITEDTLETRVTNLETIMDTLLNGGAV